MMLVELMAYIGDNLSFYLDKKYAESFLDTAQETKNVLKHAKQLGFKAFGKSSAFGTVDCYISKVPAIKVNGQPIPDMRYAGIVYKGAKLKRRGQSYETLENADFSAVDLSDCRI